MTIRGLTVLGILASVVLTTGPAWGTSVIWVSGSTGDPDHDKGWTDLLTANYCNVSRKKYETLNASKIAAMEAADLIIVSRDTNSGAYDDGSEVGQWNGITTPLILMNQYIARKNRWKWVNNNNTPGTAKDLHAEDTGHEIFDGVALDGFDNVDILDESVGVGQLPRVNIGGTNNGTVLATPEGTTGQALIVLWDTGTKFYGTGGQTAGGPRMFFGAGNNSNNPKGGYNLTAEGEELFLNTVSFMAIPEPLTMLAVGLSLTGLGAYVRKRRMA